MVRRRQRRASIIVPARHVIPDESGVTIHDRSLLGPSVVEHRTRHLLEDKCHSLVRLRSREEGITIATAMGPR